jgi:hypothetical protein
MILVSTMKIGNTWKIPQHDTPLSNHQLFFRYGRIAPASASIDAHGPTFIKSISTKSFTSHYFCGASGRIPIGPAPIIAWLTNPPLSMAHQLMCTTEISLSEISLYVAHQLMCAT